MEQVTVYEQLTISDWLSLKEKLRLELQNVTQSFVRIGYALRKIDDEKMYEVDGCKSIAEFARKEYGLEASTVSRFMAINREYSEGGYSEHLREEYIGYGQSKLSEMLQLPEKDRELVTPQMQRSDIRELKNFNRSEPEVGEADDIRTLIESYFRENKDDLNGLYGMAANDQADGGHSISGDLQAAIDLLNPSGSKVYKKGMYMLFFYEDSVKIKKFGADPVTHTWGDFLTAVDEVFGPAAAGYRTWERYFGEPEEEAVAPAQKEEEDAQNTEENDQTTPENDQEDTETVERDAQDQEMAAVGEEPKTEENGSITGMNLEKTHDTPTDEPKADLAAAMNPPEGIAPAQKEEPAEDEDEDPDERPEPAVPDQIEPKHQQGEKIFVEGVIEMITVNANKVVNYRIRTKGGKTVWVIEEDIAEETV